MTKKETRIDHRARERDESEQRAASGQPDAATNKSWQQGDRGQGREGLSKGYGGSDGPGHGPSGADTDKKISADADKKMRR